MKSVIFSLLYINFGNVIMHIPRSLRYLPHGTPKGNTAPLIKDLAKLLRGASPEESYSISPALYESKLGSGAHLIELLALAVFPPESVRVAGVNTGSSQYPKLIQANRITIPVQCLTTLPMVNPLNPMSICIAFTMSHVSSQYF